jgi:KDO2-lipid IV(A) lauroyltransferase
MVRTGGGSMANTDEGKMGKSNIFFKVVENLLLGIFHLTKFLSRILPPQILNSLFSGIGSIVFYALPGMSQRLQNKISDALPEITDQDEIKLIARHTCGAFLRPMLDLIMFWRHGDRIMRNIDITGTEYLDEADAEGKGVLLLFAHLGSFDLFAVVMARLDKPFTPIIFHPRTTPVPKYVATLAIFGQMLGCDPLSPVFWVGKDTVKKVRGHLAAGKRVGVTFDVDGNCAVELFGRPAALADGIAHFAIDSGAPIVPFALFHGKEPLDRRLIFYEPLRYELTGNRSDDVKTIMTEVAKAGERMVREEPDEWMSWFGLWHWWDRAKELMEDKG